MPKILNKRTRSTVCLGSDNERHNLDTMIISSHSQYLIQNTMFCKLARRISLVSLSLKRRASTNAARWKEEPVHEDAFAIVVRIVSQESMPLVFLFATAISITATSARFSLNFFPHQIIQNSLEFEAQLCLTYKKKLTSKLLGERLVRSVGC